MQIAPAPGMRASYMKSLETLLEANSSIKYIGKIARDKKKYSFLSDHGFTIDTILLDHSTPFMWSVDTSRAVLSASKSIPDDTIFNHWNLDIPACWWYFEEPLPFETLELVNDFVGVRALSFGWIYTSDKKKVLGCSVWCDTKLYNETNPDNNTPLSKMSITPSQTWTWYEGALLCDMLENTRKEHDKLYGPGGKFEEQPQIGVDKFMLATVGLSKFILAGLAWINQKILIESDGHIERHIRKDFNRKTKQNLTSVRVVSLRKTEYSNKEVADTEKKDFNYTCRWTVDGHFRNQACGPGRTDRRLIWISSFLKGPENMPFKEPKRKIYAVNR